MGDAPRSNPIGARAGSAAPAGPAVHPAVRVVGFDHLVLIGSDVERSLRFYAEVLGLGTERVEAWRRGEAPFPSVRIDATTIIDLLAGERAGRNVDHLCIVVEPTDLSALAASGTFDVVEGPAVRWGARGYATSLYVRDPDGNVVELRAYDLGGDDDGDDDRGGDPDA